MTRRSESPRHPSQSLRTALSGVLAAAPKGGLAPREIFKRLDLKGRNRQEACLDALEEMADAGLAFANKRGWWHPAARTARAAGTAATAPRTATTAAVQAGGVGKLSVNAKGCGFVAVGGGKPDVFIPPQYLAGAVSGDEVEVQVTEADNPRGPAGRIRRVVTERAPEFIGEFVVLDGRPAVRPLRRDLPEIVPVSSVRLPPAQAPDPGDWVEAKLVRSADGRRDALRAEVVKTRAPAHPISRTLDAVVDEYSLSPRYTAEQNHEAAKIEPRELNVEDHTHLTAVTIDPVDAKDHDDALSVQPGVKPGTVIVGVHIAEVAAYVTPGSWLDEEAGKRCFTAYLPGRTLPMLPHGLAADACSLLEGKPRLAHTVFFEMDRNDGRILSTRRCHSRILVKKLVNYDDVQAFLDDKLKPDWPQAVLEGVRQLDHLARLMRRWRAEEEHFLDMAADDIRIRCEENPPRIVALVKETASPAHELVEEFMLAANTAVAQELARRRIPGLYRNHPPPEPADLEEFAAWAGELGVAHVKNLKGRAAMNRFLHELPDTPLRMLVVREFLKTMTRAGYSEGDKSHFGLGKECYCHFTSPIRRYADLLVHQQLRAADAGTAGRPAGEVRDWATRISGLEMNNDYAYFTASDRLKLHYIEQLMLQDPKTVLKGVFARRTDEGILVYLPEFGNQGMLLQERAATARFRGARGQAPGKLADSAGKSGNIGDFIGVRPRRIDCVRGVLELKRS